MNADLIDRQLRLRDAGTEAFTLGDLVDVMRHLPADSHLVRAMRAQGKDAETVALDEEWTLDRHLLAGAYDSLRWLVWAKSKDAGRPGAKPPEPIPRPGVGAKEKKHKPSGAVRIDRAIQSGRFAVKRSGDQQ